MLCCVWYYFLDLSEDEPHSPPPSAAGRRVRIVDALLQQLHWRGLLPRIQWIKICPSGSLRKKPHSVAGERANCASIRAPSPRVIPFSFGDEWPL